MLVKMIKRLRLDIGLTIIYMEWDYNDLELAVLGVGVHTFIWLFVRITPIIFICSIIGICLTRRKK